MKHYKCKHADSRIKYVSREVLTLRQYETINIADHEARSIPSDHVKPTKGK